MNATCSAHARPDNPLGLRWIALALFLHVGFFSSSRFWTPDRVEALVPQTIQVSLIEMEAPPSEEAPAPLPPMPPPVPEPPRPRPVVAPRPTPRPEPTPETPTPLPEAPTEAPAAPAPPVAESAPASNAAANNASSASENSGAPLVEARFDASYLHNPKPPYPARSRQLREEGTARLRVHVLADGKADQVEVQRGSGFTRLDESARMTVLRWRFIPGRRGGAAVASWVIVPIHFRLDDLEQP
jgi:protein TonB